MKETTCKFGRLRQIDHLMSGVRDQADQCSETPSLLKKEKISQGLTLSPRLEYSDAIMAYCALDPLGSSDPPISASLPKMGFCHVAQAGLELLNSSDLPASASKSAGITGVSHHAWLSNPFQKRQFHSCCPGWNTMAQSWLTTTSTSLVQAILLPQPPNYVAINTFHRDWDSEEEEEEEEFDD
ncbi:hypothetical protein AAY473_033527 [Plecturocebus cupreus]